MVSLDQFNDLKERVRQAIDIVDLVGSYLQLRREGRGYKAICPWHDDARPSLQVNPERQSWKCWPCDVGGDIFSFTMKFENVDFPESLRMLAERAGIQPEPRRGGDSQSNARADEKRQMLAAMAWAEQQYHACLMESREAEPARRYLDDRGLTDQSLSLYRLGFAPDSWDWLLNRARGTSFTPAILEKVNLVTNRPNGSGYFDRFRGRVLFSIRDPQSRPIAIGGRILPGDTEPSAAKYINSAETPLFSKSSTLYGLDLAREAIGKQKNVIVTEGYTDCIIARQFGFHNVVAVLGTALGEKHLPVLKRFTESITLLLDGDTAGQKRTNEILEMFVAHQIDLRILTLPNQLDPCDYLLEHGAAALQLLLDGAVDALDHKIRQITARLGSARQSHDANQGLEEMLATLAKAPRHNSLGETASRVREQQMLVRLAREFAVPEQTLRDRIAALRAAPTAPRFRATENHLQVEQAPLPPLHTWDCELLETLLLEPESVLLAAETIGAADLVSQPGRQLFETMRALSADGVTPDFDRLMLEFDDPRMKNLLVEIDQQSRDKGGAEPALRLRQLLARYSRRRGEQESLAHVAHLKKDPLNVSSEARLTLQQLIEQQRSRQGIMSPKDG